jgi:ABC-2 type transport system permease protein
MRVYKLYFKLLKKAIPTLLVYIGVFLAITIMATLSFQGNTDGIFEDTKVRTAFINHDEDTLLLRGFKSYLGKSSEFIEIDESQKAMQDALFFREVTYILSIPKGFTEDFLNGKDPSFKSYTVPDSATNHNVDMAVNTFLNTARVYRNNIENISAEELVGKIAQDLDIQVVVDLYSEEVDKVDNTRQIYFQNYLVFAILSVLILGISSIMISFTNLDIKRRNLSSPISLYSIQFQQILGHITFAFICIILFVLLGNILNGQSSLDKTSIFFTLNVIAFTIAALSIAYLVGSLTKSIDITHGIANILGLGMSFVSGVFVPMEFLGETTIQIAKFTPAYWYTTANYMIGNLSNFTWEHLSPVYGHMLIQLGFAIAIFAISMVINKKKSKEAA